MIGGLIAAGIAALAGITGGIIQHHSTKKTNEANQQNVENTNQTNKEIQESINQTNTDLQNSINESNAQIAADTNAANERIQNSINETNAANVIATNEANAAIYKGVNDTNKAIAEHNLQFQRENLDYQKALQNQIFEREDTAYQRTAYDMAQAGLNPLTMNGTNGAGEVVSTSPLNNDFRAQAYQAIAAQAQAAHLQPYEAKAIQHIANRMQAFQAQMQSFDWLTQTLGSVGSQVDKAIQHGLQMDSLREQIKNNEVDRVAKLVGTGYVWDNKNQKIIAPGYIEGDTKVNPVEIERLRNEYNFKSLKHDIDYGLFNNSSDWERKITGLQYLMDTHRLQNVAGSITDEAFDIFNNLQKMYNRSF